MARSLKHSTKSTKQRQQQQPISSNQKKKSTQKKTPPSSSSLRIKTRQNTSIQQKSVLKNKKTISKHLLKTKQQQKMIKRHQIQKVTKNILNKNNIDNIPEPKLTRKTSLTHVEKEKQQEQPKIIQEENQQQPLKNNKNDVPEKRYKNSEIFMCKEVNGQIEKDEKQVIKKLKNIFDHTTKNKYTQIGVHSNNAYAMIVKGYMEHRIVIKIPRTKLDGGMVDSLRYEYIVGCHIRRTLCRYLPNFMKVYGYVHKRDNEYLIMQRILPGISLRELICVSPKLEFRSIRSPVLRSLILQVLCSIAVGQNMIEFVHYDLHFGNVVIRTDDTSRSLNEIMYIYKDRKGNEHKVTIPIYNGRIAIIIDFGRTHTTDGSTFLYNNPRFFKPYEFLLKPKYNGGTDIRLPDFKYDTYRFCSILAKYVKDFKIDLDTINEPHDAIKYLSRIET